MCSCYGLWASLIHVNSRGILYWLKPILLDGVLAHNSSFNFLSSSSHSGPALLRISNNLRLSSTVSAKSVGKTGFTSSAANKDYHGMKYPNTYFYQSRSRDIMYLVASILLSVCPLPLSRLICLTYDR